MVGSVIVVPCYNEAARWDDDYWTEILGLDEISLLFIDDGSTDGTFECFASVLTHERVDAVRMPANAGKAEAVRHGLLAALERQDVDAVGFLDADGAFPAAEVRRLVELNRALVVQADEFDAVWSARVMMAGRKIDRHASRHYIGRAISTLIAPMHRYDVYDTQSGFKIFAASPALRGCLAQPFRTRWFPDVEILQRWTSTQGHQMRIWEEPVVGWHDVAGSKVNRSQYLQLVKDLRALYMARVRR